MNTEIGYLYRDGSNYKVSNFVVVSSTVTEDMVKTILGCLESGLYFIPQQVSLPEKRFETINEDDHAWFELDESSFTPTDKAPTVDISAEELVQAFVTAKGKWDESMFNQGEIKTTQDGDDTE